MNLWQRLRSPLVLLALLSVLSFGARVADLGAPCVRPCRSAVRHTPIFDEVYYVNAARVIAGITPPTGQRYRFAPHGDDPNAEHPQGVKLIMAGLIELFGDGPFAWRIGSVLTGSLALLGMFALARAAGAGRRTALVAAALLATDNLLLVAGRIGTLDIYAVTAMIWAVALYLRRRPLLAGVVLGVGAACKEVTPYALLALVLIEAASVWRLSGVAGVTRSALWRAARVAFGRVIACGVVLSGVFIALLAAMDKIAPPFNYSTGHRVASGPLQHLSHIITFAAHESSPHGPHGIASYPWGWLFDIKPIVYLNINPAQPTPTLRNIYPAVHFLGVISPPMLLLAIPALVFAAAGIVKPRWRWRWLLPAVDAGSGTTAVTAAFAASRAGQEHGEGNWRDVTEGSDDWALGEVGLVGLAYFLGTYLPYIVLSLGWQRTSYLYYMVIVMPGLYLVLAALAARAHHHRWYMVAWTLAIVIAVVLMYPLTPLPS